MLLLKLGIVASCWGIAFQDFKERAVWWILFPLTGLLLAAVYFRQSFLIAYLWNITTNILLVSAILGILYLYTRLLRGNSFLNHSIGLGDVLFFYAFALGFPTYTFVILFVGALLFSLTIVLLAKTHFKEKTVPLAGLMGLFLIAITLLGFMPGLPSLYTL